MNEQRLIDRLGPDINAFDLLHIVEAGNTSYLHARKGPATGAVARRAIHRNITHAVAYQGEIGVDEAGDHDLALLAVFDVLTGRRVNHLDIEARFDIVHHPRPPARADSVLTRIHVIDPGLGCAVVVEDGCAPQFLLIFEPGIAGPFPAGIERSGTVQWAFAAADGG